MLSSPTRGNLRRTSEPQRKDSIGCDGSSNAGNIVSQEGNESQDVMQPVDQSIMTKPASWGLKPLSQDMKIFVDREDEIVPESKSENEPI